ncbi:IS200/IS605 family transposase [Desulfoferrobacter suflitae]|uniref:IS200/IS605 family transposase n=1 Tax=Desulfoferrobacter suflitae TaxID=2865782 RepID=UPI002164A1C2|nr:IS200/IS605 family transposase [Desulfoferrobacter suflitae]MCK8602203.1 IS200/IS605 family transposase [Desulfoferrobacter suflitae]
MSSTLANLLYHVVFSTKERQKIILPDIKTDLYGYLGGVIRGEKGRLLKIGGTEDHVHILASFHPALSVSDMLRRMKGNTSRWLNENRSLAFRFSWQRGYGAFSVSESMVDVVSKYIDNQELHHKKMTFQEEFLALLSKHNVQYDERYIWD